MKVLTAVMLALVVSGCSKVAEIREKNFTSQIAERFVEPESSKFQNVVLLDDEFGIIKVCGRVNTRNRLGGYSGFENFRAHFDHNGTKLLALFMESEETHDRSIFDCSVKIPMATEKPKEPEKQSPLQCYESEYTAAREESIADRKKSGDQGPYDEMELVPMGMRQIMAEGCKHTF